MRLAVLGKNWAAANRKNGTARILSATESLPWWVECRWFR
jgi:hypothetical protein